MRVREGSLFLSLKPKEIRYSSVKRGVQRERESARQKHQDRPATAGYTVPWLPCLRPTACACLSPGEPGTHVGQREDWFSVPAWSMCWVCDFLLKVH